MSVKPIEIVEIPAIWDAAGIPASRKSEAVAYWLGPVGNWIGRLAATFWAVASQTGCPNGTLAGWMMLSLPWAPAGPAGTLSKFKAWRVFQATIWSVQDVSPLTPMPPTSTPDGL